MTSRSVTRRAARSGRSGGTVPVSLPIRWGKSPLVYDRSPHVERVELVDPSAPPPDPRDTYFAEGWQKIRYGKNGRLLKVPRIEIIPGAPQDVVAFVDFHEVMPGYVYIDYMKTREDYKGRGLARILVDALTGKYGVDATYDFGRIIHPSAGAIEEVMASAGFKTRGFHDYGRRR